MTHSTDGKDGKRRKRRFVRRVWFYGIAIAIIGAMLIAHRFLLRFPVGEGPAGPAVPRERFETVWSDRSVLLLGLGDSITQGYGASEGKSYFNRLVKDPPDELEDMRGICLSAALPNLRTKNYATPGSTSLDHVERHRRFLTTQPEEVFGVVVMTTGGNDIIHDYGRSPPRECAMYGATLDQARPWIENYEQRLGDMLDLITEKFPGGCEIFLGNICDPTDGLGSPRLVGLPSWPDGLAILREYNAIIARQADVRPNVHLVDLHGLFMGHGLACSRFWRGTYVREDPTYWYSPVFEDPNDRGYDAARRAFLLAILQAINPSTFDRMGE